MLKKLMSAIVGNVLDITVYGASLYGLALMIPSMPPMTVAQAVVLGASVRFVTIVYALAMLGFGMAVTIMQE